MSNRKSNGELLRILSSLGVITCHFCGTCGPIEINERRIPDMKTKFLLFTHGYAYPLTNCFTLISGYYRIKFSLKGLLNYYLTLLSYLFIGNILCWYMTGQLWDKTWETFFCVLTFNNNLWFVQVYFCLYLFSPVINAGFSKLKKSEQIMVLFSVGMMSMYFFYYRNIDRMMGRDYIEVLFMYLIGMFIRKWEIDSYFKNARWLSLCVYVLAGVFWARQAISIHAM